MTTRTHGSRGGFSLDRILQEVDFQIDQLDLCVQRDVAQMLDADHDALMRLVAIAQEANRKSCILAHLKKLLLSERSKASGDVPVPQAVIELIQMGRESCREHLEKAFGGPSSNGPNGFGGCHGHR